MIKTIVISFFNCSSHCQDFQSLVKVDSVCLSDSIHVYMIYTIGKVLSEIFDLEKDI